MDTEKDDQIGRLQEALMLILETYPLPLEEVRDLLYVEDYPPLEKGDMGEVYEEVIFQEVWS